MVETSGVGTITISGSSSTGSAAGNNHGVYITGTGSTVETTGSGSVSVTGTEIDPNNGSGTSGSGDYAVYVASVNGIQATGSGNIFVTGIGKSSGISGCCGVPGEYGIYVTGSITANGGNITVNGTASNGTGNNNYGVYVNGSSAAITTTGTGTITVTGTGSGQTNSGSDDGVVVATGGIISNANGLLTVNGYGSGNGTGSSNYGVYVTGTNSIINNTGSGGLTINGTGGDSGGTGTNNYGIYSSVTGGIETTGSGTLTLTGIAGGGTSSYGVYGDAANEYKTTGTGNIVVFTDTISLNAASSINSVGSLTLAPYTHGNSIGIGPTSGSTDNFSDAMIADISAASYIFGATTAGDGSATTGNMTINTTTNFGNANVSFISGANISLAGSAMIKSSGNGIANYLYQANNTISTYGSGGVYATSGEINLTLDSNYNGGLGDVNLVNSSAVFNTNGGNIVIGGGTTPMTTAAGGGNIGVYIYGNGINAAGGNITINGKGSYYDYNGVSLSSNISTTGSGTITINATGPTDNSNAYGFSLGGGQTITAAAGAINITGTTGIGNGIGKAGIALGYGSSIYTTSGGAITLTGIASDANSTGIIISGTGTAPIVGTAASGNVTLAANSFSLTGLTTNSGGTITVQPHSGSTITFGGALATSDNITFTQALSLNAASTINAGAGTETFSSTINGGNNLTASAGTFSFGGAVGATTPLAAVSLTSVNTLALPTINAASILAHTTGASADISIASGNTLTASGTGNAVTLAAARNFINNDGSSAISLTGTGSPNWLIYSTNPTNDIFGSLNSGNSAVWGATYGGTIMQIGDRYIFAYQPTVTLTTTSDSKTYGTNYASTVANDYSVSGLSTGVANAFTADSNATAFSGTPTVTSTGSAASASVAGGPYGISIAHNLTGVDGYAVAYSSAGSLTVNAAPLTITANSPSMTYGASSLPTLSASYSGLANGDTSSNLTTSPTVTTTATSYNGSAGSGSSVGTYSTTAAGADDSNYNISYVGGTLTVNPATLTITANSPSMTYGSSLLPSLSASYSGFANGDTSSNLTTAPTVTTTATAYNGTAGSGSSVGNYSTTAAGAVDSNYTINYVGGTLTVGKANLTITANSPNMTYGAASLPSLSASYSGLANGDTSSNLTTAPTVTTTATAYNSTAGSGSSAGTYATTAAGAVDNNYNIFYVGGNLTVNKANLTVTADSTSMTYGGTRQPLTASYSGFVNGDTSSNLTTTPTVVSATPVTANAGTYTGTITASGTVDNNYNISYVAGDLTIGKAYLTITANNQAMTYGGTMPTLTASYSGFVNGDSTSNLTTAPTVVSATPATANAGTYNGTLTASGAVDNNYSFIYNAGNLTIGQAPLTITANSPSMTYGAASMPTLSASYTGLVNGDTASSLTTAPTVSTTAAAYNGTAGSGSSFGTYTTTASGAVDNNYAISYVGGVFTVNKANLTVTANSPNMTYGASSLPNLSASYSGLANGDTASSLTTTPTVTTAATAYNGTAGSGSSVGTYATTANGAVDNNYNISYVGGILTVNKANLTIAADNQAMTYGGTMPTLTASYTGLVNGDTSSNLTTAPTVISATAAAANAGTYNNTITASGAVDSNYTISYAAGNLTINKAPLTISADNQTITYGASVPTSSITYNGLVNGDSPRSLTTEPMPMPIPFPVLPAAITSCPISTAL